MLDGLRALFSRADLWLHLRDFKPPQIQDGTYVDWFGKKYFDMRSDESRWFHSFGDISLKLTCDFAGRFKHSSRFVILFFLVTINDFEQWSLLQFLSVALTSFTFTRQWPLRQSGMWSLSILNLPVSLRNKVENQIFICMADEEDENFDHILELLVKDIKDLEKGVVMKIHGVDFTLRSCLFSIASDHIARFVVICGLLLCCGFFLLMKMDIFVITSIVVIIVLFAAVANI